MAGAPPGTPGRVKARGAPAAPSGQVHAGQAPSKSQPTNDFVFDPTIGTSGGHVYVLTTKSLSPGSYQLHVSATGDPIDHTLPFQIK